MGTHDVQTQLEAQISRARACIHSSQQSIERSRERIDDSLRAISSLAARFPLPRASQSDDQLLAAYDRGEMRREQSKIDLEVRWTLANAGEAEF
jgi:hypothetical protein